MHMHMAGLYVIEQSKTSLVDQHHFTWRWRLYCGLEIKSSIDKLHHRVKWSGPRDYSKILCSPTQLQTTFS